MVSGIIHLIIASTDLYLTDVVYAMVLSHSVFQGIQFPSISASTDMNNEKEKFYSDE